MTQAKFLAVNLCLVLSVYVHGQSDSLTPIPLLEKTIPVQCSDFFIDEVNDLYIISDRNELQKTDTLGQVLFLYGNDRLGPIGHVDVSNPLQVLVYYPDYSTVILLDRTLTPTNSINLTDLGFYEVDAIGISNDNLIWLYDVISSRLIKIDQTGEVTTSSDDMSLLMKESFHPHLLLEYRSKVYLADEKAGIFVFDFQGRLLDQYKLQNIFNFQVVEEQIIYIEGSAVKVRGADKLVGDRVIAFFPKGNTGKVIHHGGRYYAHMPDGIAVYR